MDRFSISWEAYHELTQQDESLARTFLMEGCKAVLTPNVTLKKHQGIGQELSCHLKTY